MLYFCSCLLVFHLNHSDTTPLTAASVLLSVCNNISCHMELFGLTLANHDKTITHESENQDVLCYFLFQPMFGIHPLNAQLSKRKRRPFTVYICLEWKSHQAHSAGKTILVRRSVGESQSKTKSCLFPVQRLFNLLKKKEDDAHYIHFCAEAFSH